MAQTLTAQLDQSIDRLQDVRDAAIDADQDEAVTKLEEAIEALREIDFNEKNPEIDDEDSRLED
jgi:hypothetical protein